MLRLLGIVVLSTVLCSCTKFVTRGYIVHDDQRDEPIELSRYILRNGPIRIPQVANNASGLTFNPVTNTLFLVTDKPTQVVELDLDGGMKRIISLTGFSDTEGITYIGHNSYAIVEERRRTVCLLKIKKNTSTVDYYQSIRFNIDPEPSGNVGIEGIAFDPDKGYFFLVKEKNPRRIYQLLLPEEIYKFLLPSKICKLLRSTRLDKLPLPKLEYRPAVSFYPWDVEKSSLNLSDLAGIYYHAGTGNLLILSHESMRLVECTTAGIKVGSFSLKAGSAGLLRSIPQPEGVAMDNKGNLYICSEPNLMYVFAKRT